MRRLNALHEPELYGRLLDLRAQVENWLSYVTNTFAHYTKHTVGHSEAIVEQMSKVLFEHPEANEPVINLSAAEIYVLVSAALLHDAGMVTSDREKSEILESEEWSCWVKSLTDRRWQAIEEMRQNANSPRDHFLVDLQMRFLVAEFVRRRHHLRAGALVTGDNHLSQLCSFDDPALKRTIADVCVSHNLSWRELDDDHRFPLLRDLRGGPVNVRLMAILLRLGDLLDLETDRACPLLLNAAAPVPADSYAHWSQYQRIVHRAITPARIELEAECNTQDEHRLLQDWFQWIQDEVSHASLLLKNSFRHATWRPPVAVAEGPDSSLVVRPTHEATYIPVDWTFELDPETVYQRLIVDAYGTPLDFVRELIQNSADAQRCVVADIETAAEGSDGTWNTVDLEACAQMPIAVTLSEVSRLNELSGEVEKRHTLTVSDSGVGMDEQIIQRYLLQVGQSYYASRDFHENYKFSATSRFGLGFLSVFSISSRVRIETYRPKSADARPLRLDLTGPRNYILLERGTRTKAGTSVELELDQPISYSDLLSRITDWCKRLEFPVIVQSAGKKEVVVRERASDFERSEELIDHGDNPKFLRSRVRSIPLQSKYGRGELYVYEVQTADGKWRWDYYSGSVNEQLRAKNPLRITTDYQVYPLLCSHGIVVSPAVNSFGMLPVRMDYRTTGDRLRMPLGRGSYSNRDQFLPDDDEIDAQITSIFEEHCASIGAGWQYRSAVAERLHLPARVASRLPRMTRLFSSSGRTVEMSLAELSAVDSVVLATSSSAGNSESSTCDVEFLWPEHLMLRSSDLKWYGSRAYRTAFGNRTMECVGRSADGTWQHVLRANDHDSVKNRFESAEVLMSAVDGVESTTLLALLSNPENSYYRYWLNADNQVCSWLRKLTNAQVSIDQPFVVRLRGRDETAFGRALALILDLPALKYADRDSWRYGFTSSTLDQSLQQVQVMHEERDGEQSKVVKTMASWDGIALGARFTTM